LLRQTDILSAIIIKTNSVSVKLKFLNIYGFEHFPMQFSYTYK
jgi:hypothetical protein